MTCVYAHSSVNRPMSSHLSTFHSVVVTSVKLKGAGAKMYLHSLVQSFSYFDLKEKSLLVLFIPSNSFYLVSLWMTLVALL